MNNIINIPAVDVSIIIVNWNSKSFLRTCLRSLSTHVVNLKYEIIVVDSGSFDGCDEMIDAEFPTVHFIQSLKNIGFSRANNLGALSAKGKTLLLLNPDTEIFPGTIQKLFTHLVSRPKVGAVGCRLLNTNGSTQATSILNFPTILNRTLDSDYLRKRFPNSSLWGTAALNSGTDEFFEVEAISGACILVKNACYREIGGFSETYFMYCEDIDLCYRLKIAGYAIHFIPNYSLIHHGGGSSQIAPSNFSTVNMRISCYRFLYTHRGICSAYIYRISMGLSSIVHIFSIPLLLLFGNRFVRHGPASICKWLAVLKWSVGLNRNTCT